MMFKLVALLAVLAALGHAANRREPFIRANYVPPADSPNPNPLHIVYCREAPIVVENFCPADYTGLQLKQLAVSKLNEQLAVSKLNGSCPPSQPAYRLENLVFFWNGQLMPDDQVFAQYAHGSFAQIPLSVYPSSYYAGIDVSDPEWRCTYSPPPPRNPRVQYPQPHMQANPQANPQVIPRQNTNTPPGQVLPVRTDGQFFYPRGHPYYRPEMPYF